MRDYGKRFQVDHTKNTNCTGLWSRLLCIRSASGGSPACRFVDENCFPLNEVETVAFYLLLQLRCNLIYRGHLFWDRNGYFFTDVFFHVSVQLVFPLDTLQENHKAVSLPMTGKKSFPNINMIYCHWCHFAFSPESGCRNSLQIPSPVLNMIG